MTTAALATCATLLLLALSATLFDYMFFRTHGKRVQAMSKQLAAQSERLDAQGQVLDAHARTFEAMTRRVDSLTERVDLVGRKSR